MRIEYSGLGRWVRGLNFVLFVLGLFIGGAADSVFGLGDTGTVAACALAWCALGPVYWLAARQVNSVAKPTGREWHNEHTLGGRPVQVWAAFLPSIGWAFLSGTIGKATSGWLGWAFFVVGIIVATVVTRRVLRRQLIGPLLPRRELAGARGWQYADTDPLLGSRWEGFWGRAAALRLAPFGVVTGEVAGLPFRAFDTMTLGADLRLPAEERIRRTVWAVELPVALPLVHSLGRDRLPAPGEEISVQRMLADRGPVHLVGERADAGLVAALSTPQVLTATIGLSGWWIVGRDLLLVRQAPGSARPVPPAELAGTALALAQLAGLLPTEVLARHGTTGAAATG